MSNLMDAARTLRDKQKPLKDKYRSTPSSAQVTLSTTGSLSSSDSSLTCTLNPSTSAAARKLAGLHPAAGGSGFDASGELCSGDMLLESLVACFGVTVRAVATSLAIGIVDGHIHVSGDLDFRGTMGIKDEQGNAVPVGFTAIRMDVQLRCEDENGKPVEREKVEKLVSLSERYCVVYQTIKAGVGVKTTLIDEVGDQGFVRNGGAEEIGTTLSNDEVLPLT